MPNKPKRTARRNTSPKANPVEPRDVSLVCTNCGTTYNPKLDKGSSQVRCSQCNKAHGHQTSSSGS